MSSAAAAVYRRALLLLLLLLLWRSCNLSTRIELQAPQLAMLQCHGSIPVSLLAGCCCLLLINPQRKLPSFLKVWQALQQQHRQDRAQAYLYTC
jgi:hypothetical protein